MIINKLTGLTIAMDEPCVEQAKAMEKEQLSDAWYTGDEDRAIHEARKDLIKSLENNIKSAVGLWVKRLMK